MPCDKEDPVQRWSTADVPQAERMDYFAARMSETTYPLGIDPADAANFSADVSAAQIGGLTVCKTVASPMRNYRGREELARTGEHTFHLITNQTPWIAEHRASLRLFPRDVLVIDSRYPNMTDVRAPYSAVKVVMSEAWMRQWIPNPALLVGQRIPGNSLWGHALASYLAGLSPDLAAAPPLPLSIIADQVGGLIALTARALRDITLKDTPAVRSLHARILDCLMQRCVEPELTAVDVAASLGISVRTLHRTFAAANQTFGDKLIEARARIALRTLMSPLFKRVTTAEVGRRAGFQSASHFARVVRQRTGRTPLQLRREAHAGNFDWDA
jgi:AraC family transcriptional activator of tynA and feaB